MRLWTLHPRYLDPQGLVAVWREGLLAQAVLLGKTRGYVHHPQLIRFREQRSPAAGIASYLAAVLEESRRRGYQFDATRIRVGRMRRRIPETRGQLLYEWAHLLRKLKKRSPAHFQRLRHLSEPDPHPLFEIVPGDIRAWEKTQKGR